MSKNKSISDLKNHVESYDRMKAELKLLDKLLASEKRAEKEGWLSLDDVKKELGL